MRVAAQHITQYISLLFLMLSDVRRYLIKDLFFVVFTSFASTILQVLGFISAIRYFAIVDHNGTGYLLHKLFQIESGNLEVVLVALAVGVALGLSSLLGYLGRVSSISVSTKYELLCFYRVLKRLEIKNLVLSRPYKEEDLRKIINANTKICGRAMRSLFSAILPLFVFLTCVIIAFILESLLTGIMLLILLISLPLIYKFNRAGISASSELEGNNVLASREKSKLISQILLVGSEARVPQQLTYYESSLSSFSERLKSVEKSRSTAQTVVAISFIFLVLFAGINSGSNEHKITFLLGYFLALRFGLNSAVSLISVVSGFSLLCPKIKEYFDLLSVAVESKEDRLKKESGQGKIKLTFPLAYVTAHCASKVDIGNLIGWLGAKYSDYIYVDHITDNEIITTLGQQMNDEQKDLTFLLAKFHPVNEAEKISVDSIKNILEKASDEERFALRCVACDVIAPTVRIVDEDKLKSLSNDIRESVKKIFQKSNTVYIYKYKSLKYLKRSESYLIWLSGKRIKSCSFEQFGNKRKEWLELIKKNLELNTANLCEEQEEEYMQ